MRVPGITILLVVLALALCVWAAADNDSVSPEVPSDGGVEQRASQLGVQTASAAERSEATLQPTSGRSPGETRDRSAGNAAQGVTGRVLRADGARAGGLTAMLVRCPGGPLVAELQETPLGRLVEPASCTVTNEDGEFRLGVEVPGVLYDLWILDEEVADLRVRDIRVGVGEWYEAGELGLRRGALVGGRVSEAGSGRAIPEASVCLQTVTPTDGLVRLPGRERGRVAITDVQGEFHFRSAPSGGLVDLLVEAPGYASMVRRQLSVAPEGNEVRFELTRGMAVAGRILDQGGCPVVGALVEARTRDVAMPRIATVSDREGRFQITGLHPGSWRIGVEAPGYEPMSREGVEAGDRELDIQLERAGQVRVKVVAADGAHVNRFTVAFLYESQSSPAGAEPVHYLPDREIGPADHASDGFATIAGIRTTGRIRRHVLRVGADGHAATLSTPFEAKRDEPVQLVIRLVRGGAVVGRVVDATKRPVVGAIVVTAERGTAVTALDEGVYRTGIAGFAATRTEVRADDDGRFRIDGLAAADYVLFVAHPSHCATVYHGLKIDGDGEHTIPDIRLVRGTRISGAAALDGRLQGQVRIQLGPARGTAAVTPTAGSNQATFAVAYSDNAGRFVLPRRLPPGRYVVHAWKQLPDGDALGSLMQIRQTQREITLVPGQETLELRFDIWH